MNIEALARYRDMYRGELLENCIPFWLEHSIDNEHGGIYSSLTREGNVFATDKSVWLNARCAWMFARLCNQYGYDERWHRMSKNCLDFLNAHAIDPSDGRMYFSLTADGRPLRKRRYYFSETFYIIACAEYAKAFDAPDQLETARKYYSLLQSIYRDPESDPFKITPKFCPGTRPTLSFAPTMILLNTSHVMAECDPESRAVYDAFANELAGNYPVFVKSDMRFVLETVGKSGEFLRDATNGRTMNPGHAIEGAWFLALHAERTGNHKMLDMACDMFRWSVELGWDKQHGGLLAFVDVLGHPPEALEHDMKIWWAMCEMLICSIVLYRMTKDEYFYEWFERADRYCGDHFRDKQFGEWYGYLTYDNRPAMASLKGNMFKGPFHLPRALAMVDECLGRLIEDNA